MKDFRNKIKNPPTPRKQPNEKTIEINKLIKSNTVEAVYNQNEKLIDGFMITFSKSSSKNFDRALFLAQDADNFQINEHNNQTIYQATFSLENHLSFIALYELIGNWKSTFVFRNGKMIDRKVLGQVNYCYGDKLRSHNDNFCFGASMFTENPFGCHRLLIHSGQRPWYEWKRGEDSRYVHIDKSAMMKQIDEKAATFILCPAFNYEKITSVLDNLPE